MPLMAVLLLLLLCNLACYVSSGNPALMSGSTAHLSPDEIMNRCKEAFGSNVSSNVAIPRTWSAAQKKWKSIVIHATWAYLNAASGNPARISELKADHGSFDFWVESVSGRPTSSLIELRAIVYITSFKYGEDEGMSGIVIAHFAGFYHGPSASLCMVGCKQDTTQLTDFASELDTVEDDNAVGVAAGATNGGKTRRLMEGGGLGDAGSNVQGRGRTWSKSRVTSKLVEMHRLAAAKADVFYSAAVGSSSSSSSSSSNSGGEGGRAMDRAPAEWRSSLRGDVEGSRRQLQGAGSDEREDEDVAEMMRAQEGEGEGVGGGGGEGRAQHSSSSSSSSSSPVAQSPNAAVIEDMERQWAAQEGVNECSYLLKLQFSKEFSWEKEEPKHLLPSGNASDDNSSSAAEGTGPGSLGLEEDDDMGGSFTSNGTLLGGAGRNGSGSAWAQLTSVMAAEGELTSLKGEGEEGYFSTIGIAGSTSSIESQVEIFDWNIAVQSILDAVKVAAALAQVYRSRKDPRAPFISLTMLSLQLFAFLSHWLEELYYPLSFLSSTALVYLVSDFLTIPHAMDFISSLIFLTLLVMVHRKRVRAAASSSSASPPPSHPSGLPSHPPSESPLLVVILPAAVLTALLLWFNGLTDLFMQVLQLLFLLPQSLCLFLWDAPQVACRALCLEFVLGTWFAQIAWLVFDCWRPRLLGYDALYPFPHSFFWPVFVTSAAHLALFLTQWVNGGRCLPPKSQYTPVAASDASAVELT